MRLAFRRETELFFESILREDRGVLELLTADYTFVNERLARHYGIPNVYGDQFRRVHADSDPNRRGLLGHGSILLVTSRPNRTSPVLRGKWILYEYSRYAAARSARRRARARRGPAGNHSPCVTMRERLAAHRTIPSCAGCHSMIDPPGFALENFDAVGRWRDVDETYQPIDASGALPDGTKFDGLAGFRETLLQRARSVRDDRDREAADLCAWAVASRSATTCPRSAGSCARRRPTLHVCRMSFSASRRSVPFQMRRSRPLQSANAVASRALGP